MTQPLITTEQIEELGLVIRAEIQTNIILGDISDVITGSPIPAGYIIEFGGSPTQWRAVANSGSLGETNVSGATIGDFLYFAGSPGGGWTNTSTIQLLSDRVVLTGVSRENFGSPRFGGSPQVGSPANITSLEIRSTVPGLMLYDTDAAVNEKAWRFIVDDGDLIGEIRSDSGKTANIWLELTRSGNSVSDLYLYTGQQEKALHAIAGAALELYHNNILVAETTTAATGGLRVLNLDTGGGFERVLTTSDIGGGGGGGSAGSPLSDIRGGDGIDVTFGSPLVTIAVDGTVARLSAGSPGLVNIGTIIIDTVDFGARSTQTTFEATTTATTQVAIASYSITNYRSAEFLIEAVQGNNFHVTKILTTHDGTNAFLTEYGTVSAPEFFGSPAVGSPINSGEQATYTVDVSGGNVRLLATPVTTSSTLFTTTATLIKIRL